MSRAGILVAVTCASLGTAAYVAWSARRASLSAVADEPHAHPTDPGGPEFAALAHKLARLERALAARPSGDNSESLAQLKREFEALADRVAAVANEKPSDADAPTEPSFAVAAQRERARTERLVGFLDERLSSEVRDEAWAGPTELEIKRSLLHEIHAKPGLVSCYATLCKVEMDHTSAGDERQFLHKLVHVRALGDTEAFSAREERDDGTVSTTTFVARAGARLPEPPPL